MSNLKVQHILAHSEFNGVQGIFRVRLFMGSGELCRLFCLFWVEIVLHPHNFILPP
jgi:hypothetical protein